MTHTLSMPSDASNLNPLRYAARVPSSQIGYVNAIAESYEGACMVRTRDPREGLIEFWVARSFEKDFRRLLDGLREEMPIELLGNDPDDWRGAALQGPTKWTGASGPCPGDRE